MAWRQRLAADELEQATPPGTSGGMSSTSSRRGPGATEPGPVEAGVLHRSDTQTASGGGGDDSCRGRAAPSPLWDPLQVLQRLAREGREKVKARRTMKRTADSALGTTRDLRAVAPVKAPPGDVGDGAQTATKTGLSHKQQQ
jgi:hypothetical protein